MVIRAALLQVLPVQAILFQAIHRRRVGVTVVEVLDPLCYIKRWWSVVCWSAHGK